MKSRMSFHSESEQTPYASEMTLTEVKYQKNAMEQPPYDSEEDTDDASETESPSNNRQENNNSNSNNNNTNPTTTTNNNNSSSGSGNNNELKEQMYQHKLSSLNKQLEELRSLIHPDYLKRVKKLESIYKERLRLNEVSRDYSTECVERDYVLEKKASQKEYEEKKVDLKDNILADLEERKKLIEGERYTLELNSDSMEIKPTVTRKLRRRPNEPVPVVEKRRKPASGSFLVYLLDDKEIENDLKSIHRGKPLTPTLQPNGMNIYGANGQQQNANMLSESTNTYVETRIEDGKLLFERRWFHRGQPVYVEGKDIIKFPGTITLISTDAIWVKKGNDNKFKMSLAHLAKGKVTIKRRAN